MMVFSHMFDFSDEFIIIVNFEETTNSVRCTRCYPWIDDEYTKRQLVLGGKNHTNITPNWLQDTLKDNPLQAVNTSKKETKLKSADW